MIDKTLDEIIVGRVEPKIYAFTTNTIPDYLKVGDTYRPVSERLEEWREHYPELVKQYEGTAKINDDIYFRDFSVHQFLEIDKKKTRLLPVDIPDNVYYSKEFFKDASAEDVEEAVEDIKSSYSENKAKYQFYNSGTRLAETFIFQRTQDYGLRPNQEETVKRFIEARQKGRKNLLMYAVMRFGKSFTSMCCAVEMGAKLVVIVSAKADVCIEWKKTVESHKKFDKYKFLTSDDLKRNNHAIKENLIENRVVIFLTLQDLQGKIIKEKHKEVFGQKIDLLLVDETHFGARAEKYGEVLKSSGYEQDNANKKYDDDFVDIEDANNVIKTLVSRDTVTIHLSGTPYRILMGSEFKKEDIIAFYQFTDIVKDQAAWIHENNSKPENEQKEEWENPYYGFPQMVRFAFYPNKSSQKKLEELKKSGTTYALSALLKPLSIVQNIYGLHKKFKYEKEILELFEVIDGSKNDENLLGFLDYDKIKDGKMCRHIVIVMPYCASCDALETLIQENADKFKNLSGYEIINISGVDKPNAYKTPKDIKNAIRDAEKHNKKTITLTVNRMLTGSTVPEWDTMLYLKDTASPQEYDQAIFRLQNQYIKEFDGNGDKIKYNMKPQTLLVDLLPNRMFEMQEAKAKIYNVNINTGGNSELQKRIQAELKISPIITINKNKIVEVEAADILKAVSNYKKDKGITEEALETSVDLSILNNEIIRAVIENENEIGSKSGLSTPAHKGKDGSNGSDMDTPEGLSEDKDAQTNMPNTAKQQKTEIDWGKKIQSYYLRILLFAYITKDKIISMSDIIDNFDSRENSRIAHNLGLDKQVLKLMNKNLNKFVLSDLDYKIQDLNDLSRANEMAPEERANIAIKKFGKLGDAIVITPSNICDDMINLFPDDFLKKVAANKGRILDIAGTAGEYAVALNKKLTGLGIDKKVIANMIYTIPKSPICYELIRKMYEMLGLNTDNIARFYAEDLLDIRKYNQKGKETAEPDFDKITKIITQKKIFNRIKLTDKPLKGEKNMKFDAVAGNPPYQENIGKMQDGNDSLGKQLFPYFVRLSMEMENRYATLITPARWFTGDAQDKSFVKLRNYIKNNNHLKEIRFYKNGKDVFEGVEIKGGIEFYLFDRNHHGKMLFNVYENQSLKSNVRDLFNDKYDVVISDNNAFSILDKIMTQDFVPLTTITTGRNPFGIIGKEDVVNACSTDVYSEGLYELRCKDNEIRWIKEDVVRKNKELFAKNKVFISKSAGDPLTDKKVIGKPYVGKEMSACTDSLFTVGMFDNIVEANNLAKYMQTQFLRYLVSILKSSHNITQIVYEYVPMQDFTEKSDIDWSKSVKEIDQQLYKKYGLSKEEIEFIESKVKEME